MLTLSDFIILVSGILTGLVILVVFIIIILSILSVIIGKDNNDLGMF